MNVTLPNGKIISNVPEGTTKDQVMAKAISSGLAKEADFGLTRQDQPVDTPPEIAAEEPNQGVLDTAIGAANLANIAATGMAEKAVSGVGGMLQALNPMASEGAGARRVEQIEDIIPNVPLTPQGEQLIQSLSQKYQDIAPDILKSLVSDFASMGPDIGNTVFKATGSPAAGAIAGAVPEALQAATGFKGARAVGGAANIPDTKIPDSNATQIIKAGEKAGVPVLTTDVAPPTSFLGKWTQQLSERLGPLGSGTARQSQQVARQNVVETLAKDFNVALDSEFAGDIVNSLNAGSARKMQNAMAKRNKAVQSLNEFGEVPVNNTLRVIDDQLAKQSRLGPKADASLVTNLNNTKQAIQGGDFSLVKDIRTDIIDDLMAVRRGDDFRSEGSLQAIKSAIDKDMAKFANANDVEAGKSWRAANRNLAEELGLAKNTELRRIFKSGTATPEQVLPILFSGKRSQLERLNKSLGAKGKASAKAAIIQDAMKQSGFLSGNVNPDRLANAFNRPQTRQAIDVFFEGSGKKEIEGITKLLNATRRAQQSSAAPATGVQNLPLIGAGGVGAGLTVAPITTMATATTLSALAKAYESKGFRNLLVRLGNTKKGSKAESKLLEQVGPIALPASMVATEAQEQIEQSE